MIVGSLENIRRQVNQLPNIREAFTYLVNLNPSQVEDGRYSVVDSKVLQRFNLI